MLDIASEVFVERGYVATSMDEIAERVGVSKPMLYEYFGSKEGLLLATIREARAELRTLTEAAVAGSETGEEALQRGLLAFFTFIDERREAWSLLRQEVTLLATSAAEEVEAIRLQQTELQTALLKVYLPGVPDRDLEAASEFLVGASERMALWCQRNPSITPSTAAKYTFEIFWGGLKGLIRAPQTLDNQT